MGPIKRKCKRDFRKHNKSVKNFYLTLFSYVSTKNPYIKKSKAINLIDGKHNGTYYFLDNVSVILIDSI